MGKGDRRTKRGKVFNGSHGKTRPAGAPKKVAPAQGSAAKKSSAK
jgi:30S ribosomal protein S31